MIPTDIATVRVIKMKFKLNSTTDVKFKSKIPSQAVIGPGITGIKLPTIPIKHNRNPIIRKNKSNLYFNSEMKVLPSHKILFWKVYPL